MLRRGKIPIYEPGLEELVRRNRDLKRLTFTTGPARRRARARGDLHRRRHADGRGRVGGPAARARRRAREIARAMNGYKVIVDKSTVPVGTAERVRDAIRARDDASVQRRQQSGVPEAGRGGRRLPEARSRGDRHGPTSAPPRS